MGCRLAFRRDDGEERRRVGSLEQRQVLGKNAGGNMQHARGPFTGRTVVDQHGDQAHTRSASLTAIGVALGQDGSTPTRAPVASPWPLLAATHEAP